MFDQNATIKETDEDEDDLASEMVQVQPGMLFDLHSLFKSLSLFGYTFPLATPTEEEGNGQVAT